MRVFVVGAGGREHAIVRALRRSPSAPDLLAAPGNAGIARDARTLELGVDDLDGLVAAARDEAVDLVVVGPEAPLVDGLADALAEAGIACFGPSGAASRLEGSKAFAKEIMAASGVPTADHRVVTDAGRGAWRSIDALPDRDQGRRPGRGQGGGDRRRTRARRARRCRRCWSSAATAPSASWSRSTSRARSSRCWRCATASGRWRWRRPRTTSASSTATRGRTPAAWGRTRPCPGIGRRRGRGDRPHRPPARRRRPARARHALPRRALRRPHAHRRRARRCSSSTCASATPRPRPCCRGCAATCSTCSQRATRPGGLAGAALEWDDAWAVTVVLASRRLPGLLVARAT